MNYKIDKPNAYWLRGALPSVEQSRGEYIGSVFGAAALAYISIIHANEAIDLLQARCPRESAEARRYVSRLTGNKATMGEIRKLELAIGDQLAHSSDKDWMADFGNAAYGRVLPKVTPLQTAIANALGRYSGIADINAAAAVVVAQSLAKEAAEYVRRRAAKFTAFTLTTHGGRRMSVSSALASMSCAGVEFCLRNIARMLIDKHLPCDVDLAEDPSVVTGLKAVLNVMADPQTWIYARDKADELNKVTDKQAKQ